MTCFLDILSFGHLCLTNCLPRGWWSRFLSCKAANLKCFSVGVQFCSGIKFQQLFSDVLKLVSGLFFTPICDVLGCCWILLPSNLRRSFFFFSFLRITTNTLSLHLCVQYVTVHCGCIVWCIYVLYPYCGMLEEKSGGRWNHQNTSFRNHECLYRISSESIQ